MYNVSDAYKAAIEKPSRQFELGGEIRLKSGDVIPITDDIVWNEGDVVVDSFAMSSDNETDIGACCTAELTMSIIDNNKNHLYADAEISLICSLVLENGEKEPVPMGTFYVGANTAKRTGIKFDITAYDAMIKLHYLLTDDMREALKGCTAYQAAAYLFEDGMAQDEETVTAFSNGDLKLDFSSGSIETARDAVMWIGHLMGCFTRINRLGKLEFVELTPRNTVEHEASFGIIPERWISPNQRFKTEFSDKRMQIFTLIMRDNDNKPVVYRAIPSSESLNTLISFEIEKNPLILGQTARPVYDVLKNIIHPVHRMVIQPFTSEIANDPALEAGDYVAIQEGGDNDRGNFSSMITHNIWRYRGHHEIRSGASMQVVEFDQPVAASLTSRISEESKTYVQPTSQADKAARNSAADITPPDRLVYRFGTNETVMRNVGMQLYITQGNQYVGDIRAGTDPNCFGLFSNVRNIGIINGDFFLQDQQRGLDVRLNCTSGVVNVQLRDKVIRIETYNSDRSTLIKIGDHTMEFKTGTYNSGFYVDGKKVLTE